MQDYFFVKNNKKQSKIFFWEILYVEAVKKYILIVTTKKKYLVPGSMCTAERILPTSQFCRIHRSYIISLEHATDFDNETVYIGESFFPIGKQYRGSLQKKVIVLSDEFQPEA